MSMVFRVCLRTSAKPAAFSLLELLAVIAIIFLLSAFLIPAFNSLGGAYGLTSQGQALNDQFILARQLAMSRNRDIEMRFFQSTSNAQTNWATQLWELDTTGTSRAAVGRRMAFAGNLMLNPALSPLLTGLPGTVTNGETYQALRFRSSGRLAAQIANTNNYLTVQLRQANLANPDNYFTLQINPITGRVSTFRP